MGANFNMQRSRFLILNLPFVRGGGAAAPVGSRPGQPPHLRHPHHTPHLHSLPHLCGRWRKAPDEASALRALIPNPRPAGRNLIPPLGFSS